MFKQFLPELEKNLNPSLGNQSLARKSYFKWISKLLQLSEEAQELLMETELGHLVHNPSFKEFAISYDEIIRVKFADNLLQQIYKPLSQKIVFKGGLSIPFTLFGSITDGIIDSPQDNNVLLRSGKEPDLYNSKSSGLLVNSFNIDPRIIGVSKISGIEFITVPGIFDYQSKFFKENYLDNFSYKTKALSCEKYSSIITNLAAYDKSIKHEDLAIKGIIRSITLLHISNTTNYLRVILALQTYPQAATITTIIDLVEDDE